MPASIRRNMVKSGPAMLAEPSCSSPQSMSGRAPPLSRGGDPRAGSGFLSFYQTPRSKAVFLISGVTKDLNGAVLGSCIVDLYRIFDPTEASQPPAEWYARTTSDASTGAYSFSVASNGWTFQAISYKAGGPDVAGITVNTLTGAVV